jgi:MFS-type transporter involved in bile tolerance (Atg22 family)
MLGKFAAVTGPVLTGTIALVTRCNRMGILSILILFEAEGIILQRVDEAEGKKNAMEYL